MNPKLNGIIPEFKNEDILFLKFNMTDEFSVQQSEMVAERLNKLFHFLKYLDGSTAYLILLESNPGQQLHTLRSDQTEEKSISNIKEILSLAQ